MTVIYRDAPEQVSVDQAYAVHDASPVFDFVLSVRDVTVIGNSSKESCFSVFDRLPAGFQHDMLLRGSSADIWGDTIWDMTMRKFPPPNQSLRLRYDESAEKGFLRYEDCWDAETGYIWQVDINLEIVWDGCSIQLKMCLPDSKVASPYFWALLPMPARDQLAKMSCSPEMFNGIVMELWQMSETFPTEGVANVKIVFPKTCDTGPLEFATDGKSFNYLITDPVAVPYEAHFFILASVSSLGSFMPHSQAVRLACELAAKAELAPKATMSSPLVIEATKNYIARFLKHTQADKAIKPSTRS